MTGPAVRSAPVAQDPIEPLAEEWDRLADRLRASPFLRPGWSAAWWRAFGRGRLEVLTVRRGNRLAGVLPMARRRGGLESLANYHTPWFGPLADDPAVAADLLRQGLAHRPRRLELEMLEPTRTDVGALAAGADEAGYRVLTRTQGRVPFVDLSGDWTSFMAERSRGFRKELRRCRRRLDERGEIGFEVSTGDENLSERLREALAVESSGWKGERGTAIVSRAETRRFYEEIAHWAARRGILRLFFLRLDGTPIAVDYALEEQGVRFILKGGFEVSYSRQSPGALLLEAGLEQAFSQGLERVELGGGDHHAYKLRWTRSVRERCLLQAFSPSLLGKADHAIAALARPLAKQILGGRT